MTNNEQASILIRNGDKERGLDLLRQAAADDPSVGHLIELGSAYLWAEFYDAAWEHFQSSIKASPQPPAEFYALAGVAKWCLGDSETAATIWTAGLGAIRRRDDDRGFRLPLLMFAAAIVRPEEFPLKLKAWTTLLPKLQHLQPKAWPSVLADITTGIGGQPQVPELSPKSLGEETRQRKWLADFYRAVAKFHLVYEPPPFNPDLKARELKYAMQQLSDTTQTDCVDTSAFQSLISHEEFFLARFLASAQPQIPTIPPIEVDWENLRFGDGKQGIEVRTERFLRKPSAAHTLGLGVAYLWTKDYESAWNHFQYINRHGLWTSDTFFGMAGAAKWCLDQPEEAIECWRAGLKCDLGDAGGASVGNYLLLFAASILREDLVSQSDAKRLLHEKSNDRRIKSWPGPLVEFCLKNGSFELDLLEARAGIESRRAVARFYKSLIDFNNGVLSRDEMTARMREIADTSLPQWKEDSSFSGLLRKEEFFVARHEASAGGWPRCRGSKIVRRP
jgi:tetratricopeptide (TPR) repeat protein